MRSTLHRAPVRHPASGRDRAEVQAGPDSLAREPRQPPAMSHAAAQSSSRRDADNELYDFGCNLVDAAAEICRAVADPDPPRPFRRFWAHRGRAVRAELPSAGFSGRALNGLTSARMLGVEPSPRGSSERLREPQRGAGGRASRGPGSALAGGAQPQRRPNASVKVLPDQGAQGLVFLRAGRAPVQAHRALRAAGLPRR